jgi:DNA invertase Pin-like site-specific DNA recombinase
MIIGYLRVSTEKQHLGTFAGKVLSRWLAFFKKKRKNLKIQQKFV